MSFLHPKNIRTFISRAVELFTKHDLTTLAAALSFYTALSIAPLLIIMLSVLEVIGENNQIQFLNFVHNVMGKEVTDAVSAIISSVNQSPQLGTLAGISGIIALLFSASGALSQLQSSLNVIFDVAPEESAGFINWLRNRAFTVFFVATLGLLAVALFGISTLFSLFIAQKSSWWTFINVMFSFGIFTGLFSILFKYLPDLPLHWIDSLRGGAITALLFVLGKLLIEFYLSRSAIGSAYGAAGSFIVLLAWVYYSSIIVLAGAELTNTIKRA